MSRKSGKKVARIATLGVKVKMIYMVTPKQVLDVAGVSY